MTSSSNSDLQGARLDGAEAPSDDDGLVSSESVPGQAIAMIARRRLTVVEAAGRHVANRRAWLTKTRAGLASEHADRIRAVLALEPAITAEGLAERLQPSPVPTKPAGSPVDDQQRAQRRAFDRNDEYRHTSPDSPLTSRDVAKARIAELRQLTRKGR